GALLREPGRGHDLRPRGHGAGPRLRRKAGRAPARAEWLGRRAQELTGPRRPGWEIGAPSVLAEPAGELDVLRRHLDLRQVRQGGALRGAVEGAQDALEAG